MQLQKEQHGWVGHEDTRVTVTAESLLTEFTIGRINPWDFLAFFRRLLFWICYLKQGMFIWRADRASRHVERMEPIRYKPTMNMAGFLRREGTQIDCVISEAVEYEVRKLCQIGRRRVIPSQM